jgi:hypothetical protein
MRWKNKTHGIRADVRSWSNDSETTGDYLEESSGAFKVPRVNTCTTFSVPTGLLYDTVLFLQWCTLLC